jgi:hypothetical protein
MLGEDKLLVAQFCTEPQIHSSTILGWRRLMPFPHYRMTLMLKPLPLRKRLLSKLAD